jgi:hypothetical protein
MGDGVTAALPEESAPPSRVEKGETTMVESNRPVLMRPRGGMILLTAAILGLWAPINISAGQEAPTTRPVTAQPTGQEAPTTRPVTAQPTGENAIILRDFVDLLKTEAARSEKAAQATADSAHDEIAKMMEIFTIFAWVLSAILALGTGLAIFFGIRSLRDIRREADKMAKAEVEKVTGEMQSKSTEFSAGIEGVNRKIAQQATQIAEQAASATANTSTIADVKRSFDAQIVEFSNKNASALTRARDKIEDFIAEYKNSLDRFAVDLGYGFT